MFERLLLLGVLAVAVGLVVLAFRVGGTLRGERATRLAAPAGLVDDRRPLLLSFTTPGCADCRYRQVPAVSEVEQALGAAVETRLVDASRDPDLALHFGILTAPSTVILDRTGQVAARNDGFAPAATLLAQLRPLLAA